MNDMKTCPFCGGDAWVREHTCISRLPYYTTHCSFCGVSDLKHHKSKAAAIKAWNMRYSNDGYVSIETKLFIFDLLRREERVTRDRYTQTVSRLTDFKETFPTQTQIIKLIEEEINARAEEHNKAFSALRDLERKRL